MNASLYALPNPVLLAFYIKVPEDPSLSLGPTNPIKGTHLILALEHQDVGDPAEGDPQVDDLCLGDVVGDVADVDDPRGAVLLHGVQLGPLGLAVVVDSAVGGGSVGGRGGAARAGGDGGGVPVAAAPAAPGWGRRLRLNHEVSPIGLLPVHGA